MNNHRHWFKCHPRSFLNGAAELTPNEGWVYTICLMRMCDSDGAIPDDPIRIARRCNMRRATCEKALDALCMAGVLVRKDTTPPLLWAPVIDKWRRFVTTRESIPERERVIVFERDGGHCVYCGSELEFSRFHCDHVIPVSRGGATELENLVASCPPCNLMKGAKTPEEWLH